MAYDAAISDLNYLSSRLNEKLSEREFDFLVLCETIVALGTIFLKGKPVVSRIEIAIGKGSIVTHPPPILDSYILLEADAWGNAVKVDLSTLSTFSSIKSAQICVEAREE